MVTKKDNKKDNKKAKRSVSKGVVHIQSSFNNTIVTISDFTGNALSWSSSGAMGFRGAKKNTPYAAQVVVAAALEAAEKYKLREVEIHISGPGYGREAAIRAVARTNLQINLMKDVTGIPHNGCRPRKMRN